MLGDNCFDIYLWGPSINNSAVKNNSFRAINSGGLALVSTGSTVADVENNLSSFNPFSFIIISGYQTVTNIGSH